MRLDYYSVFLFLVMIYSLSLSLFTCRTRCFRRALSVEQQQRLIYLIFTKSNPITVKDFGANRSMNHISHFFSLWSSFFPYLFCHYFWFYFAISLHFCFCFSISIFKLAKATVYIFCVSEREKKQQHIHPHHMTLWYISL